MKTTYLASLRGLQQTQIAKIGLKSIARFESARLIKWYLILPSVGYGDSPCILLHKCSRIDREYAISKCDPKIIAEETARAATRLA